MKGGVSFYLGHWEFAWSFEDGFQKAYGGAFMLGVLVARR